jgi:hypothetical protein
MLAGRQMREVDRCDLSVSVKVYFLRCLRRDSQMLFAAFFSQQTSLLGPKAVLLANSHSGKINTVCLNNGNQRLLNRTM